MTLQRFIDAQACTYDGALREIRSGRKRSHWMWFIFPQLQGLGHSSTSRYYALSSMEEAASFLQHPLLGKRLLEITRAIAQLPDSDATRVFGNPDDLKLRSSMTLFAALPQTDPVFQQVLNKFFQGNPDPRTEQLLAQVK